MDTCLKLTPRQAPELDTSGTISTGPETQGAGESSSDSDVVPSTRKRARRSLATPEVEKGLTKVCYIVDLVREI